MLKRTTYQQLWEELSNEKPMIFISGPRQSGKTTLARGIADKSFKNKIYFNWDIVENKKTLIENPAFFENINRIDDSVPLVIFDEIHKYKDWRNYLKGVYDQFSGSYKFLVSGSGRLDLYQRGGDSLAGRYFNFHLFPFTVAELSGENRLFRDFIKDPLTHFDLNPRDKTHKLWMDLYEISGFPEPFTKGKNTFWTKWSQTYARQIIRDDVRSIIDLKNIDDIEILFSLIPSKVGSPISINSIAQDMRVAFETVKNWIRIFDLFYLTFQITPWSKKISRAITKEKKIYLFNYPLIQDKSVRFENMAALELLRAVNNWNDHGYGHFTLHYVRNKEKNEVDFLIADNNIPLLLLETKLSDDSMSKSLADFQSILNIPSVQLVNKDGVLKYVENGKNKVLIVTAHNWLSSLP